MRFTRFSKYILFLIFTANILTACGSAPLSRGDEAKSPHNQALISGDETLKSIDGEFCPQTEPCRILPLGDSITFGIGFNGGYRVELFRLALRDGKDITFVGQNPPSDRMNQPNGPKEVMGVPFPRYHLGTSGITIQQLNRKVVPSRILKTEPEGKSPHIVLLHIGTNDMWAGPRGAELRLGELIDSISATVPDALIVVSNIIPWPQSAKKVLHYNTKIPPIVAERAAGGANVLFVDQFSGFPSNELGDGVHPNQKGYSRMARAWYNSISRYLKDID